MVRGAPPVRRHRMGLYARVLRLLTLRVLARRKRGPPASAYALFGDADFDDQVARMLLGCRLLSL
jgi:hypothetical protein